MLIDWEDKEIIYQSLSQSKQILIWGIFLLIKNRVRWWNTKTRTKTPSLTLSFPGSTSVFHSWLLFPSLMNSAGEMDNEWDVVATVPLYCCSFLLSTSPLLQQLILPWAAVRIRLFRIRLFQHGSFTGCSSLKHIHLLHCGHLLQMSPLHGLQGNLCSGACGPSFLSFIFLWCLKICFSDFSFTVFLLCLKYISPKVPSAWLNCSAVSCGGSIGYIYI